MEVNMKANQWIRNHIVSITMGMWLLQSSSVIAQCSFSSGSTGADGAFNPTNSMPNTGWSVSNNVVTVTNKTDGRFDFTSVYIETNWVVKFTRNTLNTPVYILATTNVTIKGTINVTGGTAPAAPAIEGGIGGPGGFAGGTAKGGNPSAGPAFGPGAGIGIYTQYGMGGGFGTDGPDPGYGWGPGGPAYGTIDIQPFIGGSGGGGYTDEGNGGGGGGGAMLIASSTTIDISGSVLAAGGNSSWAGGSGGAIRLIATTIQGEGQVKATGGNGFGLGAIGRIRMEACNNARITLTQPPATFGPPGAVFLNPNPTIKVSSIAGQNTPWPPAGSLTMPDVYLPTNFVNPATISVSASNVNFGTTFKVIVGPVYGTNITATGTLSSGNYAFSTGSVTMNVYTDRVWRVNALIDYIPRP
jgi:hypothetical protein